jgi:hypothetical protein
VESQLVIKVILIVAFAAFAIFLMLPGRGARHLAMRRLAMVLVLALTVLAVIFPNALDGVAHAVGVGRGADLLLYGLIVVFVGNALVQQRRSRHVEREMTLIARRVAIAEAQRPPQPAPPATPPSAEAVAPEATGSVAAPSSAAGGGSDRADGADGAHAAD